MAKVDYGAVALIPVGEYSASRQYHANELVGYQGSSYIALQNPPVGTLPTNTTYFMLHTEGTSVATASTPGTVKPDGTSTVVDASGAMSVKPSIVQTIQDTAELAAEVALKIGNVPTGKPLQSQIDDLEPRVSSSEDALTVNLLNPTRLQSQTYYGITIVRNSDNTFTLSGTNEKNETQYIVLEWLEDLAPKTVAGKQYKFFGIPSGLTGIQIKVGDVRDSGNGATFTAPPTGDRVSIIIPAGFSFSEPATFKPMITANLSATYDDYVPYSGSSGKLNTDYVDLLTKIRETDRDTVVNMLNPTLPSGTGSGLTYVKNGDNSYTISGTNNTENTKNLILAQIASIGFESGKTYRVLGCPSDTPAGVYMMVGSQIKENGGGANFAYPVSSGQSVYISVAAGATIETPITIKPMITTNLYATYDDYVPYTGDSGRLNEDVVKIRTDVAQNTTDIAANAAGIAALNTGLATKISTHTDTGAHGIREIAYNTSTGIVIAQDAVTDEWYSLSDKINFYGNVITPLVSGFTMTFHGLYLVGRLRILIAHIVLTQNYASETVVAKINTTAPIFLAECTCRDNQGHFATFRLDTDQNIMVWGQAQATNGGIYLCQFTYFA